MSLNGLDASEVNEAYQSALSDGGCWFLLKYTTRDEVALYEKGSGGVVDARDAVNRYEEPSPLYGFIHYRRRKVILRYVPDGMSRLLQARVAVHFQSVTEKFAPQDTIFSFTAPSELKDSMLASECSLHTASMKSSNDSLPSRSLAEIVEDEAEPQADEAVKEQEERKIGLPSSPDSDDDKARHERALELVKSVQASASHEEHERPSSAAKSIRPRTASDTNKALPSTPDDTTRETSKPRSIYDFGDTDSRLSIDGRLSSETTRPNARDLYEYKPKVKLGPRLSIESTTSMRASMRDEFRPVALLPAGVRMPSRKATSVRPQSQHSQKTFHDRALSRESLPVPLPMSPIRLPENSMTIPNPRTPISAKILESKSPKMTPEKRRLMKALQLRQKQLAAQTPAKELEPELRSTGYEQASPPSVDTTSPLSVRLSTAGQDSNSIQSAADSPSKETPHDVQDSPTSAPDPSEGLSTQASSIYDEASPQKESDTDTEVPTVEDSSISATEKPIAEDEDPVTRMEDTHSPQTTTKNENEAGLMASDAKVELVGTTMMLDQEPIVKQDNIATAEGQQPSFQCTSEELMKSQQESAPTTDATPESSHQEAPVCLSSRQTAAPNPAVPTEEASTSQLQCALPLLTDSLEVRSEPEATSRSGGPQKSLFGTNVDKPIDVSPDNVPLPAVDEKEMKDLRLDQRMSKDQSKPVDVDRETETEVTEGPSTAESQHNEEALTQSATLATVPESGQPEVSTSASRKEKSEVISGLATPRSPDYSEPAVQPPTAGMALEISDPEPSSETPTDRHLRRRGVVDPLPQVLTSERSDEQLFLDDDSFMEELKTATVQEAKPISVSKSPIKPVFSRLPSEQKGNDASRSYRSRSSPQNNGLPFSPPQLPTPGSFRSFSATQAPLPSPQSAQPPSQKKVGVSSGISQRIKALEKLSSRPSSPVSPPATQHAFATLRKTSSSRTPPPGADMGNGIGNKRGPNTAYPSPSPSPDTVKPDPMTRIKLRPESISVTATIVRNESYKSPEKPLNPSEPQEINLHQSPLFVEHQAMEPPHSPLKPPRPRYARNSSARSGSSSSAEQKTENRSSSRRNSAASKRSHSSRNESELDLPRSPSENSINGEEKKDSKRSRLLKRMSSITTISRRSFAQALTSSPKEASIMEQHEPILEPKAPPMVDLGDVNIQFPDTLLWKRRHMVIDGRGILVLTASKADNNSRVITKNFSLSDFCPPYIPDQDRQELANSVILDFKDGSTLQCACEHPQGQAQVLHALKQAHTFHDS